MFERHSKACVRSLSSFRGTGCYFASIYFSQEADYRQLALGECVYHPGAAARYMTFPRCHKQYFIVSRNVHTIMPLKRTIRQKTFNAKVLSAWLLKCMNEGYR